MVVVTGGRMAQDLGMAMTHAAALADELHVNVFAYEYVP